MFEAQNSNGLGNILTELFLVPFNSVVIGLIKIRFTFSNCSIGDACLTVDSAAPVKCTVAFFFDNRVFYYVALVATECFSFFAFLRQPFFLVLLSATLKRLFRKVDFDRTVMDWVRQTDYFLSHIIRSNTNLVLSITTVTKLNHHPNVRYI